MTDFTATEIEEIDALWRQCAIDHVWTGWAKPGARDNEIWIFRLRANWRRFSLRKGKMAYRLVDERGRNVLIGRNLAELLDRVDKIPGLNEPVEEA